MSFLVRFLLTRGLDVFDKLSSSSCYFRGFPLLHYIHITTLHVSTTYSRETLHKKYGKFKMIAQRLSSVGIFDRWAPQCNTDNKYILYEQILLCDRLQVRISVAASAGQPLVLRLFILRLVLCPVVHALLCTNTHPYLWKTPKRVWQKSNVLYSLQNYIQRTPCLIAYFVKSHPWKILGFEALKGTAPRIKYITGKLGVEIW